MERIDKIREQASQNLKKIVLPEAHDVRVVEAAAFLNENKLVVPVLLGKEKDIRDTAKGKNVSVEEIEIIDPEQSEKLAQYAEQYYELRKHKGISMEDARAAVRLPLFYGAMMIRNGEVEGAVAGSSSPTADVMRAAIQIVGMAPNIKAVSSSFLMVMPDGREMTFGDCAVIPNPDVEQLASIAVSSAQTHQRLTGTTPNVAMLSFSTKGSAKHEDVDKVVQATRKVQEIAPDLNVDGELQFDAALVESIARKKAPGSLVAGKANVFIFPDLDAGNIGYKIAQRLGGGEAIGPVVQGLSKPYNDLSRGCSVEDIINVACICSLLS